MTVPRPLVVLQTAVLGVVLARLARGRTRRAPLSAQARPPSGPVSVVMPARDEASRIAPCLRALRDDPDVAELLVVDDCSTDATATVAAAEGARVLAGAAPPAGWVGKPWALEQGLRAATGDVVVFLDADTRPRPGLVRALAAALEEVDVITAGPRFDCRGPGERLLHPAMLTSLVLRFGPSDAAGVPPRPGRTVGNGQCLAARRAPLREAGGFAAAAGHMTDDIALLRALARAGWRVGFVDGASLLEVRMHESAAEVWREWGRSLALVDVTSPGWLALDLIVVWVAQGLPLVRLAARRGNGLDATLLALRLALLPALRGSYARRGAAFWLSPLVDPLVAARLALSVLRPAREWRGRRYGARGRA